ncbi:sugar ABC transporter permease [Oscillochloris sp. ZM17-4]|uniref:carbohydrate ABC transporter permease n=1 Tax=Oscillochloris sp. ZM17-4 TaxID=2866714 RepID=UPI001C729ECA|nr:sugar ABC transporter permease [Oscillochloris sp. ZM17-4]MBX0331003.1 sugar ABC transporter permease [Oscillochloris sp. ZM17-4]
MNNYHFGRGRARLAPYLLLLPGFFFYLVIMLGPSIATGVYSFTDASGIQGTTLHWIGLENYREFLFLGQASIDNYGALFRTLVFSFFVTTIQFSLGLGLALLVNQRLKGINVFRTIFFMPVILGAVIQGLIWSLFLYPLGGPLASILGMFGMRSEFLGGQPNEAIAWVIFVQIWANLGVTMMIFIAGLQTIPEDLYEGAQIDGASRWQVFRNITWPMLTPSVNTNLLLNIIGSLQAWQLFLVLIGYRNGTQVLGYLIFAQGFGQASGSVTSAFRQGYAAAASIVLFCLVLGIGLPVQYFLQRREKRVLG